MIIPFKVKLLTETAKAPEQANKGDLWDLFADNFKTDDLSDQYVDDTSTENLAKFEGAFVSVEFHKVNTFAVIKPQGRILVRTGIALELPTKVIWQTYNGSNYYNQGKWIFSRDELKNERIFLNEVLIEAFAVADIRPRSELALKHGITVLNSPATIDNSYRKEIGIILYNAGHEPYTIKKNDKIAQMLIRPLYPSSFEIVKDFEDTGGVNMVQQEINN